MARGNPRRLASTAGCRELPDLGSVRVCLTRTPGACFISELSLLAFVCTETYPTRQQGDFESELPSLSLFLKRIPARQQVQVCSLVPSEPSSPKVTDPLISGPSKGFGWNKPPHLDKVKQTLPVVGYQPLQDKGGISPYRTREHITRVIAKSM